jgi:hypothetical protein
MGTTPKHLVQVLDFITKGEEPQATIESLHVRQVRNVRSVFEDPNIVGVGVGKKVSDEKETDELCVCFYVEKKLPPSKVTGRHFVPPVIAAGDGRSVYTDVKKLGRVSLEAKALIKRRPIESGFSVGHVKITAGTLGAIVKKGAKRYLLSNSHILANSGKGRPGDKIVYPGPDDGGEAPADWVAVLSKAVALIKGGAFVNKVDAALAEIRQERAKDLQYALASAKLPLGVTAPKRDMIVTKRGRTTGKTKGKIIDIDFRIQINYPGVGKLGFTNQVLCERYTDGGDSGSLVLDAASGKIVGLHFAGAEQGSVFNPIDAVMKALNFTFASR